MIHIPVVLLYAGYVAARHYLRQRYGPEFVNDVRTEAASHTSANPGPSQQRIKDWATLGLEEGASAAQIEEAFRRLALIHHPDLCAGQPADRVEAARQTYMRLQAARDRLLGRNSA